MKVNPKLQFISPIWYERIKHARIPRGLINPKLVDTGIEQRKLNLQKYECCIVGEAYLFRNDYRKVFEDGCWVCERFADKLYQFASDNMPHDFNRILNQFIKHSIKIHNVKIPKSFDKLKTDQVK